MGFGRLKRGLNDDLAKDRYGIAYIGSPVGANLPPECKLLEVSRTPDGPFYAYTIENLQSRKYPMHDEIYGYVDVDAQGAVDPKVREYLRFIVSREGQQCVQRDGKYLPLTAEVCREMQKKLQ
jgi:phosphate transport system substrate-binding protein